MARLLCSASPYSLPLPGLIFFLQVSSLPQSFFLFKTLVPHGFYSWYCSIPSRYVSLSHVTLVSLSCRYDFKTCQEEDVIKLLISLQNRTNRIFWAAFLLMFSFWVKHESLVQVIRAGMQKMLDPVRQSTGATHDCFTMSGTDSQHFMGYLYARKVVHIFQTDLPPCLIHYFCGLIECYFWVLAKRIEMPK